MFHEDGTMRQSCKSDLVKQFENEVSPVNSLPVLLGSMHACRNIHETRKVVLYIKGVSHGFAQMVYYCLDLFLISLQSCLLHFCMDMLELLAEIKSAFEKGEFSIRQTSGSFNGIWSDMGTEKPS
jgi:hypothetical protein